MQKNWYAVYTKPNCEKKVFRTLNKLGIEAFFPLNYKRYPTFLRGNFVPEPLFKSFIFLRAEENQVINLSKQVKGVLSLLYWLGQPATIDNDDINAIREFATNYKDIALERLDVNLKNNEGFIDNMLLTMDGKILMIKNRTIKINLPSLGYTLIAQVEDKDIFGRKSHFDKSDVALQQ